MLIKILKKDFLRKKIITMALFIFILLTALLLASGSNMIMELFRSIDNLFTKTSVPHFVQTHSGEIDQSIIDSWASSNSLVKKQQTVEMINIDGSNIFFGNNQMPEKNSIMDFDFVRQNKIFDFLLNLESQVIQVSRGEIAVPIYFKQQKNIKIGDKVKVSNKGFVMEFTVTDFVRDVQMNPSIISSKRFVVNEADYETLKTNVGKGIGEIEYLIEFQLNDLGKLNEFSNQYQSANLPEKGTPIDYNLFKTLNALTDGMVAAVIILISILLIIIALLCLRFTILVTLEEDYREIGIMKAIGIQQSDIKRIYLAKYVIMAALASFIGYLASLFFNRLFTANIILYIGSAPKSILQYLVSFMAVALIFFIVVSFCMLILRKFNKISTVQALRSGNIGGTQKNRKLLSLNKNKFFNVNIFLGLRDVFLRFRMFSLLFIVFFVCSFIIIVPLNFLNTIQSQHFTIYMGVEQSDIRIDLQQSDNIVESFNNIINYIAKDKDVERFSPLVTYKLKVINSEGGQDNFNVETGDYSIFSLEYLKGSAPIHDKEIALSYLNANELKKSVGDNLRLVVNGKEKNMVVSGIYQDITNGGKTAKALSLNSDPESVLRYVISLDIKPQINIGDKINEYSKALYPAKVTYIEDYLGQTFGNVIEQLKLATILAFIIAICVSILITSLFLKMLVANDYSQIAIMKSIGFSLDNIRVQYVTRALLVLNIGIIIGAIVSNTIGQSLVSVILSFMGASKIEFVINPVQAYILCPLTLMVIVTVTSLISIASIKKSTITEMIAE
ncbi:MAG: ABC transporter permease [Ruminiclostridium sp.]